MLMILSPAKKLDERPARTDIPLTQPTYLRQAEHLIDVLRNRSEAEIAELMDLSPKLAALNVERYQRFGQYPPKQALTLFKGDVYQSIKVDDYTPEDFAFAQQHLRILSGLYGLLAPLDATQPYRLEMGSALATEKGKNLYAFWGKHLVENLNQLLDGMQDQTLVNLASTEYAAAIPMTLLCHPLLTIHFKERRGNKLQTIGLMAKRARGAMAHFAITQRITQVEGLKAFADGGYVLDETLTTRQGNREEWVFVR